MLYLLLISYILFETKDFKIQINKFVIQFILRNSLILKQSNNILNNF